MASPGELAAVLSRTLGIKLGTVNFYGQALRDAGLLTTGGRGPAAATMSDVDAANWLLALLCAETAASAGDVVELTRKAPFRKQRRPADPDIPNELLFPKARDVGGLIVALLEDERARRLRSILLAIDFRVGGGHVDLTAYEFSGESGINWRASMEFVHPPEGPRRKRDPEESPADAKCVTLKRISRGVFEDINKVLCGVA